MRSKAPAPRENHQVGNVGWFATFTFLDLNGAMASSQLRRLAATTARVWRLVLRNVSDWSKPRVVGV